MTIPILLTLAEITREDVQAKRQNDMARMISILVIITICVGIMVVKFGCEQAFGVEIPGECVIFAIIVGVLALLALVSELR